MRDHDLPPRPSLGTVEWPRVYRARKGHTIFSVVLGGLSVAGGAVVPFLYLSNGSEPSVGVAIAGGAFLVSLGAVLIAGPFFERVVLHEDAIEIRQLGSFRKHIRRCDIVGLRFYAHGFLYVVFERSPGLKSVRVSWLVQSDAILDAWLGAFRNLDAEDLERSRQELLQNTALGATEEARFRALVTAHRVALGVFLGCLGTALWAFAFPRPYTLVMAILALMPPLTIALVVLGRGLYTLADRRNDARAELLVVLLTPGLALAARALADFTIVDVTPIAVATLVIASALLAAVLLAERAVRRVGTVIAISIVCALPYGWGLSRQADVLLDDSPAEVFHARVESREEVGGRGTSYYLRIAAWGPRSESERAQVGRELYAEVEVGDDVCIDLHPGALGARWYRVRSCRDGVEQ